MSDTPHLVDGNGDGRPATKLTLTLTYDVESFQVSIGGDQIPLSLAQMMLDEAGRGLEQQRRIAAAAALRDQMAHSAAMGRVAIDVMNRRH